MANKPTVIVGGGISGLTAALEALDRGETDIHIYEASDRMGGHIRSEKLGNYTVNKGAEFIDSKEDAPHLHKLAARLKVDLLDAGEQGKEMFFSASGKPLPNFLKDYAPVARRLAEIREQAETDPAFAEKINAMSARELVTKAVSEAPVEQSYTLFEPSQNFTLNLLITVANFAYAAVRSVGDVLYNGAMMLTFQSSRANRVSSEVAETALAAMEKEQGATADNITAAQCLSEFSPSEKRFLAGSCGYRVDGGTEELIKKLEAHLANSKDEHGNPKVHFHKGHTLTSVKSLGGNEREFTFATADGEQKVTSGKSVMALAAYSLPKIEWLDANGRPDADMAFLKEMGKVQYTNNAKVTFRLKPGVKIPDANIFMPEGEFWSPDAGYMTVLYHNVNGKKPPEVMQEVMAGYARMLGKEVHEVFEVDASGKPLQGSVAYTNPGNAPCWSTPSPKYHKLMLANFQKMEALSHKGLGFAGTYIPLPDGCVGFMECGAASAERACERMFGPARAREHEIDMSQNLSPQVHSFASRAKQDKGSQKSSWLGI